MFCIIVARFTRLVKYKTRFSFFMSIKLGLGYLMGYILCNKRGVFMLQEAYKLLKTKKYIIQAVAFTALFMVMYTLIDSFNMSYALMRNSYGSYLVVLNIVLNVVMAGLSALLMNLSSAMVLLKGQDSKGANMSFVSVLFGIFTYGCTPCVIAFFANIGITFSVFVLPLAGLPYKLVSLLLLGIGLWWTAREIDKGVCKVKYS